MGWVLKRFSFGLNWVGLNFDVFEFEFELEFSWILMDLGLVEFEFELGLDGFKLGFALVWICVRLVRI